jgi:hypothetical protein
MTEVIEIQFDEEDGHLQLDCSGEDFTHIRDLVVSGASAQEKVGPFIDGIRFIGVRHITAIPDGMTRRVRRRAQMLLIFLTLAAALVVQAIGIVSVVRWFLGRAA